MTLNDASQPALARSCFSIEHLLTDPDHDLDQDCRQSFSKADKMMWIGDLLSFFIRNQINVAPAMPFLAILLAVFACAWVAPTTVIVWTVATLSCQALQIFFYYNYFSRARSQNEQSEWIGILSAAELLQGVCWVAPLFLFWQENSIAHNAFLVVFLLAVITSRLLIVNNFMPVLVAGTGIMTIGLVFRFAVEGGTSYVLIAVLVIAMEAFFLIIARKMGKTARQMIIFKAQKDTLIAQLRIERDKAEEQSKKAEEANRAKSIFLATMSHELRTPLNAIMGFSEVLEQEMFGPITTKAYKGYAGDIHNSGRYLLDLINDILDLSRIEAGRRDLLEEPFNVITCIKSAGALLDIKLRAKSITLATNIEDSLPKLMGDIRAVNQVLINLIDNAIKFSPVSSHIHVTAKRNPLGGLTVCVKDQGPGIPAHEIKQVLDSFSRGSAATKKAIDGAGLGLSIVKGLMDLHGGDIDILSEVGKGTEMILTFPAKRVLTGPRGEVIAAPTIISESQRRLIALTG